MSASDLAVRNLYKVYGLARKARLMELAWFQRLFLRAYFLYKRLLEDSFAGLVRKHPELFQAGHIIDVGSNVGYTAVVFARVVSESARVFSFEPEPQNIQMQRYSLEHCGVAKQVTLVEAAVGDHSGTVELWHNKGHLADHRIVTKNFEHNLGAGEKCSTVSLLSIDDYLAEQHAEQPVAFIKIDVQGFELPVCHGMEKTLDQNPNAAIVVEYSPESQIELGYQPQDLIDFFVERGYQFYLLDKAGSLEPLPKENFAVVLGKREYFDFLAVKQGRL